MQREYLVFLLCELREGGEMRSRERDFGAERGYERECVGGPEREARGGERREGDVLGLGKRSLGCRERREKGDEGLRFGEGGDDEGSVVVTEQHYVLDLQGFFSNFEFVNDILKKICSADRISRWDHTKILSDFSDGETENSDGECMDTKTVSGRHSKFSSLLKSKASLRSVTFDNFKKIMDSWHGLSCSNYCHG
ncbi:hypothetical protein OIU84_010761 [Salix udensis]|uniref:Uncharacterized protein n=1 Tax=Salix udensis TaxID=889485 RepID=A0AAD6NWH6_9ROSI|nr:hypothetical protein OIU84_010761 [Salix udensis]